jgi:chromosome segregation ATPase
MDYGSHDYEKAQKEVLERQAKNRSSVRTVQECEKTIEAEKAAIETAAKRRAMYEAEVAKRKQKLEPLKKKIVDAQNALAAAMGDIVLVQNKVEAERKAISQCWTAIRAAEGEMNLARIRENQQRRGMELSHVETQRAARAALDGEYDA